VVAIGSIASIATTWAAATAMTYPSTGYKISSVSLASPGSAVAVDAGTHKVFVANTNNTVSVIDGTTRAVVNTLGLFDPAHHIAIDPLTHYVYVATLNTVEFNSLDQVAVFDGTTNEELFRWIGFHRNEDSVAIDPAGHRVFMAPGGMPAGVERIQSFDTVTHFPLGYGPQVWATSGAVFDDAANRLFLVNKLAAGTVGMFDASIGANPALATAKVGAFPAGIALDAITRKLFVANKGSHSVSVIDAATDTVTATVAVGSSPSSIAIDHSTHVAYVGDDVDKTVTMIDGTTYGVTGMVGLTHQPSGLSVDASTHAVWVSLLDDNSITVLDQVVPRLFGADRFGTSASISTGDFTDGSADAVVLARSDSYPDAVVGAPLAVAKNAPLLFASGTTLPATTKAEIRRVLAPGKTVYLLGGVASVPDSVAGQLTNLGYRTVRLGGANRFATAVAVADELGDPGTVLLASGGGFADALAAGPAASHVHGAVLLTAGSVVPPETASYLAAHSGTVYAIGGPAANAYPAGIPIAGPDRFATAVAVARQFFSTSARPGIAGGATFPDALAAGAFVGRLNSPLLLTDPLQLSNATRTYLAVSAPSAVIFGGPAALAPDVERAVDALSTR
jgi:YVTN family beta-propeller protein